MAPISHPFGSPTPGPKVYHHSKVPSSAEIMPSKVANSDRV